jgi:hypothetical protein
LELLLGNSEITLVVGMWSLDGLLFESARGDTPFSRYCETASELIERISQVIGNPDVKALGAPTIDPGFRNLDKQPQAPSGPRMERISDQHK